MTIITKKNNFNLIFNKKKNKWIVVLFKNIFDNAIKYSYIIDDDVLDFDTPQNDAVSYPNAADKFFNKDSNAIVRYFEETGGKGLPGFIESMDFDWNNMPWSVEQGSRAPKMCKVTLSFSPVHDITPGIDHLGYNRAAVYRLGPFRRKG